MAFSITISRISRVFWCRVTLNQTSTKGKEGSPLNKLRQRSSATTWIRGYDPLNMVSFDSWRRTLSNMKFLQSNYQIQILTVSYLPREILENIAYIYHCITGLPIQVSHVLAVYFSNGFPTTLHKQAGKGPFRHGRHKSQLAQRCFPALIDQ